MYTCYTVLLCTLISDWGNHVCPVVVVVVERGHIHVLVYTHEICFQTITTRKTIPSNKFLLWLLSLLFCFLPKMNYYTNAAAATATAIWHEICDSHFNCRRSFLKKKNKKKIRFPCNKQATNLWRHLYNQRIFIMIVYILCVWWIWTIADAPFGIKIVWRFQNKLFFC